MNARQQRFVQEYLIGRNATAAYKRAGYTAEGNAAEVNASRLLRNAQVKAAIEAAEAQVAQAAADKFGITQARVLEEYAKVAFSDVGQLFDLSTSPPTLKPLKDLPDAARQALASVKVGPLGAVEFKLWDKLSALEKLGKHLGLFKDAAPPTGAVPPVEIRVITVVKPHAD